ncbi:MAG TPA: hypothetical protein PK944_07550, partial [Agitococcus sp.]|nr:hypothetical protein [Agitococcus sp.]
HHIFLQSLINFYINGIACYVAVLPMLINDAKKCAITINKVAKTLLLLNLSPLLVEIDDVPNVA